MERKRSGHENKEILAGVYFKVYGGAVILHHLCQGMSKKTVARLNTERFVKINHTFFSQQACRGSFKTHNDTYRLERWQLETEVLYILMQMEEFSKAWNCKKESFMNNLGKPRCMRWVPDPTPT